MKRLLLSLSRSSVYGQQLIMPIASSPKLRSSASSPPVSPVTTGNFRPAAAYCFMNRSGFDPAKPWHTPSQSAICAR